MHTSGPRHADSTYARAKNILLSERRVLGTCKMDNLFCFYTFFLCSKKPLNLVNFHYFIMSPEGPGGQNTTPPVTMATTNRKHLIYYHETCLPKYFILTNYYQNQPHATFQYFLNLGESLGKVLLMEKNRQQLYDECIVHADADADADTDSSETTYLPHLLQRGRHNSP